MREGKMDFKSEGSDQDLGVDQRGRGKKVG